MKNSTLVIVILVTLSLGFFGGINYTTPEIYRDTTWTEIFDTTYVELDTTLHLTGTLNELVEEVSDTTITLTVNNEPDTLIVTKKDTVSSMTFVIPITYGEVEAKFNFADSTLDPIIRENIPQYIHTEVGKVEETQIIKETDGKIIALAYVAGIATVILIAFAID